MKKKIRFSTRFFAVLVVSFFLFSPLLSAQESTKCLECHEGLDGSLLNTPHELKPGSAESSFLIIGCSSCHEGWRGHMDDPSADNIETPDEISATAQGELCGRCHVTRHQMAMVSTDPHSKVGLKCTSCHTIHGNMSEFLVKEDLDNYCVSCHGATAVEFNQRSAHPVESGNIRCVDCHDLSSIDVAEFDVGFNWKCQSCHDELSGPFPYEHEVVYGHLVEGGTCIECHEPHGSVNDRLLKQPGRTLCLQCHGIPLGHQTAHSGLGARYECVQCHSEIHGSFNSRLLLDPDLGDKLIPNCYQAGCHSLGNQGG